jgi:hypothetical protein
LRPGKIRISHAIQYEDIWIDEYLSLPDVGIMFMVEDEETKEPVMNTLFTSGVLIQEWEDIMSVDDFHAMVLQQKENIKQWSSFQVQKETALKKLKEQQSKACNSDPSTV